MKGRWICLLGLTVSFGLSGCSAGQLRDLQRQNLQRMDDQIFKTAIALIELHKVRFGEYPKTLDDLKFLGEWDKMINGEVAYKRVDAGYELDLTKDPGAELKWNYPPEFWKGLGLIRSNIKH